VVGGTTPLVSVTTDAAGTAVLNGGSVTTSGAQTYNDPVTLGAGTTLSAGTATVKFNNSVAAGGNALTVRADGIDFLGVAGSVTGTSTLTLEPSADATTVGMAGGWGRCS
jgi:hypothetical protein